MRLPVFGRIPADPLHGLAQPLPSYNPLTAKQALAPCAHAAHDVELRASF